MGQQTAVTLNTVVYNPAGTASGRTNWVARAGDGIISSFSTLWQSFKLPTTGKQIKIDFQIAIPVTASADSQCSCAGELLRTNTATVSVWVADSSTTAERTDLYLRLKDLIASATFIAAVENLDPAYG